MKWRTLWFATVLAVSLVAAGCGSTANLSSAWQPLPEDIESVALLEIDPVVQLKGRRGSVTFRNDGEHLYVRFVSSDRTTQFQVVGLGLTVWFEGAGSPWGIYAPVGLQASHPPMHGTEGLEDLKTFLDAQGFEIQILPGISEEPVFYTRLELKKIKVRTDIRPPLLIHEILIPLAKTDDTPFALGVAPGGDCIVRLETPDFVPNPQGGPAPRIGHTGSRGRRGGGGRPAEADAVGHMRQEPLRAKFRVTLAQPK